MKMAMRWGIGIGRTGKAGAGVVLWPVGESKAPNRPCLRFGLGRCCGFLRLSIFCKYCMMEMGRRNGGPDRI